MISVAPYRWLERAGTAVGCRMAAVLSVLALAPSPAHSQWAVQDEMVAGGPAAVSYVGRAIGKVGVFCANGGVYAFLSDFYGADEIPLVAEFEIDGVPYSVELREYEARSAFGPVSRGFVDAMKEGHHLTIRVAGQRAELGLDRAHATIERALAICPGASSSVY